jgi:hypothetical protein
MGRDDREYYLGDKNLPTGNKKQEFTPEMIKEIIACSNKITNFTKYFFITTLESGKQKIKLYRPQRRILKSLVNNRFNIVLASRQVGKAQPLYSKLLTPTGWIQMGDVSIGDEVIDMNGIPTKVNGIYPQGVIDNYRITFTDGSSTECSGEHLWNVKGSGCKHWNTLTLNKIIENRGYNPTSDRAYRIPLTKPVEFTENDHIIDPYLMGILLGDGSFSSKSDLRITTNDDEIIKESMVGIEHIIIPDNRSTNNTKAYKIKDAGIIEELHRLDLFDKRSHTKFIPDEYLYDSVDNRIKLLQGLMDTDGSIYGNCVMEYSTTSQSLKDGVKFLVESLGGNVKIKKRKSHYTKNGVKVECKDSYRVYVRLQNINPFKLERKASKWYNIKYKRHRIIKSIERLEDTECQCISVDSDTHTYLTDDFIVTHNTTMMTIYALWVACFQNDKTILIVANKEDTSKEILSRIKMAYEQLPNWLKPGVEEWAKTEVKFSNDSRIRISTTSSSAARGLSINCLIVDEMAFIPEHIIQEFWNSVIPVISSYQGTKVFVVSTPNGAGNLFHTIYSGAERNDPKFDQWNHERIDWWEIPGRGKKWERDIRSALAGQGKSFDQEFGNCFLETGHSAIDSSLIDLYRNIAREPKLTYEDGNYKIWETPNPEHLYAIGVDVGEGIGQAASVAQILDITDLTNIELVASYHNNVIDPFHFGEVLYKIANQWGRPMLAIERNNCGGQVIDALKQTHNYHNIIDHTPKTMTTKGNYYARLGIYSHTNSKYQGIMNMRYWMNALRVVKIYDINLVQELETFVRYPNGTWKAKPGEYIYDDRVLSLVWGLFALDPLIAQKYYDIPEYDSRGKPARVCQFTIEESKYFKLDQDFLSDPNGALPTYVNPVFGADDEGIDALEAQGWSILR